MVKDPPTNAGDAGSVPGWGRSHGVKGMAPHSNILAWKMLCTEQPGGLQSMGPHRVRQDGATEHYYYYF